MLDVGSPVLDTREVDSVALEIIVVESIELEVVLLDPNKLDSTVLAFVELVTTVLGSVELDTTELETTIVDSLLPAVEDVITDDFAEEVGNDVTTDEVELTQPLGTVEVGVINVVSVKISS